MPTKGYRTMSERAEMMEARATHPAPQGALPTSWAMDLADEINNRYELGLSDAEAGKLSNLIMRRAFAALKE